MPVHPSSVVPVTEYVVVFVCVTVTVLLDPRPSDQLYVVPVISDLAISSVLSPRHISVGFSASVIVC